MAPHPVNVARCQPVEGGVLGQNLVDKLVVLLHAAFLPEVVGVTVKYMRAQLPVWIVLIAVGVAELRAPVSEDHAAQPAEGCRAHCGTKPIQRLNYAVLRIAFNQNGSHKVTPDENQCQQGFPARTAIYRVHLADRYIGILLHIGFEILVGTTHGEFSIACGAGLVLVAGLKAHPAQNIQITGSQQAFVNVVVQCSLATRKFVLAGSRHNMGRLAVQPLRRNKVIQILQFLRLHGYAFAGLTQQVVCHDLRALGIVAELDIPAGLSLPLWAAVAAVRGLGKARAVTRLVVRTAGRVADLGTVSTACAAAIVAAQAYHCAEVYAGTEHGVTGAGLDLVAVADDFAGDGGIALAQALGNLVERCAIFQFLLDDKTVFIG